MLESNWQRILLRGGIVGEGGERECEAYKCYAILIRFHKFWLFLGMMLTLLLDTERTSSKLKLKRKNLGSNWVRGYGD